MEPASRRLSPTKPGIARLRTRATQQALVPSEQAAAGSGLLSELQLSPRTECAYPPPSPQAPKWNQRPAAHQKHCSRLDTHTTVLEPSPPPHPIANPSLSTSTHQPHGPATPPFPARPPIPTGLRPKAQGWPAPRRPTLGQPPQQITNPKGVASYALNGRLEC
jgi:hypothetical protein